MIQKICKIRHFFSQNICNKISIQLVTKYPAYNNAVQALFQNDFKEAEQNLTILKNEVELLQNPQIKQEVLDLYLQLYTQTQNFRDLLTTQEEKFFIMLANNQIYNDDNQQCLKELLKLYIENDPNRGTAMLQVLNSQLEELIPLGYQKEYYIYAGTLEMFNKNYTNAETLFTNAQNLGPKDDLLGMCLNNQVILQELNIDNEIKSLKGDFEQFCTNNIKNLLDSIITFELASSQEKKKELAILYKLIEQTEKNIEKKEINAIINEVIIQNQNTFKVIYNLIDLLINNQCPDKATAWIKTLFKIKTQNPNLVIPNFGRSLLQYAKICTLDKKYEQAEQILLDFLNSNSPRKSFLQMMGLTQYSLLLKIEGRNYEADSYEKQAINISSQISPTSFIREQIILL